MTEHEIFSFDVPVQPKVGGESIGFGIAGGAHGHIYSLCKGLTDAGAVPKCIFEPDAMISAALHKVYPNALICGSYDEMLERGDISLIASAAIPSERAGLAVRAMEAGKNFIVDKAPAITCAQLDAVKSAKCRTGMQYAVYYSEYFDCEPAIYAAKLIERGLIGKLRCISGSAPHRLAPDTRPEWFFDRNRTGGILTDIGSQQTAQMLMYSGANNGTVDFARVVPSTEFDDFDECGDAMLTTENGVCCYMHVDWLSPRGLSGWGDARTVLEGSEGFIEVRKNCDICHKNDANNIYLINGDGEFSCNVNGKVEISFFREFLNSCVTGTEMSPGADFAFNAAELAIEAQEMALRKQA